MLKVCKGARIILAALPVLISVALLMPAANAQQLGTQDLKDKHGANEKRFKELLAGTAAPDPVSDKAVIATAAEYLVYRVTWPTVESQKWEKGMKLVQDDFKGVFEHQATLAGTNAEFMKALCPKLVDCLKEVLKQAKDYKTRYTAVTNASLMLPVLAKSRQDSVHDFLMSIAKALAKDQPKTHPFVRMSAIKGLGEFNLPSADTKKAPGKDKLARDLARLDVIREFIAKPYDPEGDDPEHVNAFAYVRREGVKALANLQTPAIDKQGGKIVGPVAYYLLLIANGEQPALGPPFTLSERTEAAIAVCNLKPSADFNSELAVYVVGNFLTTFADEYRTDYPYFKLGAKPGQVFPPLPSLAWKSLADRLLSGLTAMQAAHPNVAKKLEGLQKVPGQAAKFLDEIRNHRPITASPEDYVKTIMPARAEVYVGQDEHRIAIGGKSK